MKTKPKIFISVPENSHLDGNRKNIKCRIVEFLIAQGMEPVGFEPEQFGIKGLTKNNIEWTFDKATKLISECDGIVVIGLARTFFSKININEYDLELSVFSESQKKALEQMVITGNREQAAEISGLSRKAIDQLMDDNVEFQSIYKKIKDLEKERTLKHGRNTDILATEYNHVEGAIALSKKLPTSLLLEYGIERSGIFNSGFRPFILNVDDEDGCLEDFENHLKQWINAVSKRRDVFLGYCSKANTIAVELRNFIEEQGFTVLDWSRDFTAAGRTILEEIERASTTCRCAVFLFTKDDEVKKNATAKATFNAIPRDNVLAEAGYFMRNISKERVAIIRESGAKMPVDFGGLIYISMGDKADLLIIKQSLQRFLLDTLEVDLS